MTFAGSQDGGRTLRRAGPQYASPSRRVPRYYWQQSSRHARNSGRVVNDDGSLRSALDSLFRTVGLQTCSYGSVQDFLEGKPADSPGCVVLDVRLPGMSGLEFQEKLADLGNPLPVVQITGHGDVPMSVKAMKHGAIDFLLKPFRDQDIQVV